MKKALSFSQLKEYDLVKEFSNHSSEKPVIAYLCATWCHPCMDKLIPILDSFSNNDQYELVILFDKWIFSKKNLKSCK